MCSMSCFPCFGKRKKEKEEDNVFNDGHHPTPANIETQHKNIELQAITETGNTQVQSFTFRELATATKNFTPDCLLGEGGLGRVYKGCLANGQTVAIKKLGRDSLQEINEFLVKVSNLSLLNHPNLVSLVGYCADGEQRLLVHEFIPNGSLENHLFDLKQDQKPLDWYTRMKIAYGAAQGLEYLHDKANPPIIYRELKSSNFLLDQELKPKLSDYGLGKLGTSGDKPLLSSSLMGTYGYCAPECSMGGEVTVKSDVYSFGVVLLELITGRRALDTSMPSSEQNLVSWAQPMFHDQKRYPELADLNLKHDYPASSLNQAVAIASMCLQDEPSVRPIAADVVTTLSFLIEPMPTSKPTPNPDVPTQPTPESEHSDSSYSDSESSDDEHVVETLQLGKRKQKQGSRTSSKSRSSNGSALNDRNNLSSLSSKCPIYDDYGSKKSSSGKLVCSSSKYYDDAYEFDENEGSSSSKNHEERSLSVKHSKKGSKKIGSSSKHHENYEGISENEREKHHEERSLSAKHSKKGSKKIGSSSKHHDNYEDISKNEREEHHEERSLSVKHSKKGSKKIGSSSKHHEISCEDISENEKEKSLSMKKDSRSFKDGSDSPGSRHQNDDHESGSDDSGSRHSDEKSEGSKHEYESD